MIQSTFGGLTFSTDSSELTIETLDGWYSGPPVRSEIEDRPNADGAFGVTRVYKGARVITQTGMIHAPSADAAILGLVGEVAGLQADGLPSPFAVLDASGEKFVTATLAGPPEVTAGVGGNWRYVLQLVARDPVKYGPEKQYTTGLPSSGGGLEYNLFTGGAGGTLYYGSVGNLGRVTVTNDETAETWPVMIITGGLTAGFIIQCLDTGEVVRYDRVVPAGTFVTLDFRTGEVLIDGVSDGSTYLTRDDFFSIPARSQREVQFSAIGGSTGTPLLTVKAHDGSM